MTGPFATRLFRIVFALAGSNNLVFGVWVVCWPLRFFEIFHIAAPRYPTVWACLGMVVGVYGLLYWHAAWKPECGWTIIAIGLLGKVLGPLGMLLSFSDEWPRRLAMLNLFNDVIWWLPFSLFLIRGTALAKQLASLAPWCCAGFHALGLAAMVFVLRPGMLTEPDVIQRATYISQNSTLWAVAWGVWMLSAVSLVGFYAWWGSQLTASLAATVGVLLAALGSVFDLTGESLCVLELVERSLLVLDDATLFNHMGFASLERTATLLTAGVANALYTLGGMVLMSSTPNLPGRVRAAMWGTWMAGAVMTVSAIFDHLVGMVATTTLLFPLLIIWTVWMGRHWRRA